MPYCFNPSCPNPENLVNTEHCQTCGAKLLLRDRYQAIRGLGQGGFGATFLALNKGLPGEPQCVIKQLRPSNNAPNVIEMARDLFKREAKTLGKIGSHPEIPTLMDYFDEGSEFYLVQEFVNGLTLQQEVKQNGPFTEVGVRQFLSEILPLIQYIHSQQVIHRDIKPANIIRRNHDRKLVLIDFGAVKDQVNPAAASASEQTALTSYAIGTPGYAPPEQMAMRPVYSSDIYALGVTCLFLLTGKAPKDFGYDPRTGEMQWRKSIDVGDNFAEVLAKMLDASVKHRYQMSNDVLRALEMEPYLESLAQGMIKPTTATDKATSKPTKPRWGGGTTGSSMGSGSMGSSSARVDQGTSAGQPNRSAKVSEIAERIRQRRAAGGTAKGSGQGRPDSTQVFAAPRSRSNTSGGQRGSSAKSGNDLGSSGQPVENRLARTRCTAEQVVSNYAKGVRDFAYHELSNLDLSKALLADVNFHDSRLFKTNLQGADLTNTTLSQANFSQCILRDAILARAFMNYTNLQNADLRGADLSYAHLSNANLRGANLSGANLTGAKISEEQLALAKTSWNTTMPNGKAGWRQ
ncbi:serine/threonine-protein kinase [Prochlorothrix hollandica]|uniref:serine/threonine-protein kinase n=1 Tax=Prochlorothrix hollandica TaxID=1223 RepID=UPI003341C1B6